MQDPLYCQGGIQINQANAQGDGVNFSIDVSLPNGPAPGTVWAVDALSAMFVDNAADVTGVATASSAIFLVPVNSTPSAQGGSNPDNATSLNFAARAGVVLNDAVAYFEQFTGGASTLLLIKGRGGFIVPAGYTIKVIFNNGVVGAIPMTSTAFLFAQFRILKQQ